MKTEVLFILFYNHFSKHFHFLKVVLGFWIWYKSWTHLLNCSQKGLVPQIPYSELRSPCTQLQKQCRRSPSSRRKQRSLLYYSWTAIGRALAVMHFAASPALLPAFDQPELFRGSIVAPDLGELSEELIWGSFGYVLNLGRFFHLREKMAMGNVLGERNASGQELNIKEMDR